MRDDVRLGRTDGVGRSSQCHTCVVQVMKLITDKYGDAIKFVICTGLSNQEAEELSAETGAAGHLCKPYEAKAVLEMLRKLVPSSADGA